MDALLGVTYSEFDNKVGPQLRFSWPVDIIQRDFESLSDYVIVGKHLCGKILTIRNDDLIFVNHSIALENSKYDRNTLLFSFGFVLRRDTADEIIEAYEAILRKISSTFVSLENESEFLFKPNKKSTLPMILKMIYENIKSSGDSFVYLDASNILTIKLQKFPAQPPPIRDYDVPMLLYGRNTLSSLPWDIALGQIIPYIDNISVTKIIAANANMDIDYARNALQMLLYYECIIISDAFKFSNIYELVPQTTHLICSNPNNETMRECFQFCREAYPNTATIDSAAALSIISDALLCLEPGRTLGQLRKDSNFFQNLQGLNIDVRKFIAIAQHKSLIRRIYEYPLYSPDPISNSKNKQTPSSHNNYSGPSSSSPHVCNHSYTTSHDHAHTHANINTRRIDDKPQSNNNNIKTNNNSNHVSKHVHKISTAHESIASSCSSSSTSPIHTMDSLCKPSPQGQSSLNKHESRGHEAFSFDVMDGSRCLDEICCQFENIKPSEIFNCNDVCIVYR